MFSKKTYQILVGLFPLIYIIHNFEEWFILTRYITNYQDILPDIIKLNIGNDLSSIKLTFGIAIIFATVLPFIILPFLYGDETKWKVKLLVVIAFVSLINSFSHISTSIALGILSPGLISAILLVFPYSIFIILFTKRIHHFDLKIYIKLLAISIPVYIVAIASSWFIGVILS